MRRLFVPTLLTLTAGLHAQLPPATTGDLLVSSSGNDRLLRLGYEVRIAQVKPAPPA